MYHSDKYFMRLAIKEALKAEPSVYPNPKVGAIIVKNGKVLSTGFHKSFGSAHAEEIAIKNLESSYNNVTLYVTLEPCSHKGKTDPCTELIDKDIFQRVVIGSSDPNPLACGGANIIRKKNIQVDENICQDETKILNKRFFTYHEKKRPYIILKMASTMDGFIAEADGYSKWITNQKSRESVHKLRASCDAILVGRKTIEKDNPFLTSHGKGKNPKIVLLDPDSKLDKNKNVFQNDPIVFSKGLGRNSPKINIKNILDTLYTNSYQTLLVEGGGITFSHFLNNNLFDELHIYFAPKFIGDGIPIYYGIKTLKEDLNLHIHKIENFDNDIKIIYHKKP